MIQVNGHFGSINKKTAHSEIVYSLIAKKGTLLSPFSFSISLMVIDFSFIALSISLLSSLSFRSCRLSCVFLPVAQAINIFNQPFL